MGLNFDETQKIVDIFSLQAYQDSAVQEIFSLTTKVHSIVVRLLLEIPKAKDMKEVLCECSLEDEGSYCECPVTTDKFWELLKEETTFGEEIDAESLPSVQTEEELIATCFAYVLSIPNWEDRDDFFIYPFVEEVLQRVQHNKGQTLETLRASLEERGIKIPHRKIQNDELYVPERKNEILRLLALHKELFSEENRWILDATEQIVRSYWKVMHQFKLQRTIHNCVLKMHLPLKFFLKQYSGVDQSDGQSILLNGNMNIQVRYIPEGIDDKAKIAEMSLVF